jgi:hypothetical protein
MSGAVPSLSISILLAWTGFASIVQYLPVLFLALRDLCTVTTVASVRRGEIILDVLCMYRDRQTCHGFLSKGGHVDFMIRAQLALFVYLSQVSFRACFLSC